MIIILIFFKRFANRFGSLALPDFIEEKFLKFCCHTFIQSRGSHSSLVNADVANWEKNFFLQKTDHFYALQRCAVLIGRTKSFYCLSFAQHVF